MPELLDELKAVCGQTRVFGRITLDAGNTSLAAMSKAIRERLALLGPNQI